MEGCTDGGRPHFPGPSLVVPLLSHGCPFLSSPSICPWGHPHLSAISRARVASCSVLTGINLTCFSQEREKGAQSWYWSGGGNVPGRAGAFSNRAPSACSVRYRTSAGFTWPNRQSFFGDPASLIPGSSASPRDPTVTALRPPDGASGCAFSPSAPGGGGREVCFGTKWQSQLPRGSEVRAPRPRRGPGPSQHLATPYLALNKNRGPSPRSHGKLCRLQRRVKLMWTERSGISVILPLLSQQGFRRVTQGRACLFKETLDPN